MKKKALLFLLPLLLGTMVLTGCWHDNDSKNKQNDSSEVEDDDWEVIH